MKQRLLAGIALALSLLSVGLQIVGAQNASLSENGFWGRLNQTEVLLRSKLLPPSHLSEEDQKAAIDQIRLLWDGVEEVHIGQTPVKVDLGWIRAALTDG